MRKIIAVLLLTLLVSFGCLSATEKLPMPINVTQKPENVTNKTLDNSNFTNKSPELEQKEKELEFLEQIKQKVIPENGTTIKTIWGNIGPLTVKSNAINITKLESVMKRNGAKLNDEQYEILINGSNKQITINKTNAYFMLNFFWAFGLTNKNQILKNGTIALNKKDIPKYASVGGWPLGNKAGNELFNSIEIIKLDNAQQQLVEEIASATYRPCCNNPTSFPDCNHGMAALGLLELMAYQNATKNEMYSALLIANSYWFPQNYIETAAYLEYQNTSWNDISPKELLSANYSSYNGYMKTKENLQQFPKLNIPSAWCGV